jgi:hypothetical protein
MRSKEEIIKDISGMEYKNDTNKDIYKLGTPDNHTGVDFRKGGIVPYWWRDNERIDDPEDVRAQDSDDFMVLLQVCGAYDVEKEHNTLDYETIPEEDTYENIRGPIDEPEEVPVQPTPEKKTPPSAKSNILDLIHKYVGNDVLEVFGDTGTGKSKLALHTAQEAIKAGLKVHYLDTERNLTEDDLKSLRGCEYKYTPKLDEIDKYVRNLPKGDVVIIDSIGFPILTSFARLGVKQKGDALQKLIAIFGDLKVWAYENNGFVLVTNQPESEFNKEPGHIFRPFGDKAQFAAKEIWKTEYIKRTSTETKSKIIAFRSRSAGYQTKVAEMSITDKGVDVKS